MANDTNILPNDQNHYRAAGFESTVTPGELHAGQIIVATGRIKVDTAGGGSGTVTEVDTGTGLTGGPITTTGTISLATNIAPIATLGSPLQSIRVNAGATALEYYTPSTGAPGGLNAQLQYNNSGAFGGITNATTDGTSVSMSGAHLLNPTINGAGAGLATLAYPNTASSVTITFPATTGTVALTSQLTTGTVTSVASADGSITVTNPNTTVDLAVVKAPILTTARTIGIATGDATSAGSTFNGSANNTNALTLATVNGNVGSFGSATQVAAFTVNAKGLTTAASNITITPAVTSITGLGTGVATALAINVGSAGAFVTFNGALGTPSSGTLTSATGLPISTGVTGLGSGIATFLATPSSANLAAALTDETGTGKAVFATKPTFIATVQTVVAVSALAIDGSLGSYFTKTIATGSTLTQSNFVAGQIFTIKMTGAFTVTWFSGITWLTSGGTAPTQAAVTAYGFICTGSNTFDGYLAGTQ